MGHCLPLISFSKPQTPHSLEDNMASENTITQPSRKAIRSTSQASTTTSITSIREVADVIDIKLSDGTVPSQSHKIPSLDSNLPKGVNKTTSYPLNKRFIAGLKIHQSIPQGTDELQAQANPTFQPFGAEGHSYTGNDS